MKVWRLIGEYNAETKTYSAFAGTVTSPYTPDFSGRLIGLRAISSRDAATTLQAGVQIRLTCTTFNPNSLEIMAMGGGLQTAPSVQGQVLDYEVDQPVVAGVPISIEGRNLTADTPVGVLVELLGLFATS